MLVVYGFDSYNQAIDEEIAQPLRSHGGGEETPKVIVYDLSDENTSIEPGAHPGSHNGQDAYSDLLITGEIHETMGRNTDGTDAVCKKRRGGRECLTR